jgi:tRNA-Thr(GGU) m(6)t(6)A37 methyltransferase TsaA
MSIVRAFTFRSIGVIRSPHRSQEGAPVQPAYAAEVEGEVIVDPAYEPALADLEGFERIWLVYVFDRAGPFRARVVPYRDDREHGLFATRSPCRPNPVGISAVRLIGRQGAVLRVRGVDVLDGTPLLDIKPYIPDFDAHAASRAGWFDERREDRRVADGRFADQSPDADPQDRQR